MKRLQQFMDRVQGMLPVGQELEAKQALMAKENVSGVETQREKEREWKNAQRASNKTKSLFVAKQARSDAALTKNKEQANASMLLGKSLAGLRGISNE